jgi:uncharacterized protein YkwD
MVMRRALFARRLAAFAVAGAALGAAAVVAPAPASAFTVSYGVRLNATEARLAYLINNARTSRGIPALVVAPGTTDLAREWAMNQAQKNVLYHNPNLVSGIQSHGSYNWRSIGENVGRGWDPDTLFAAYMKSPGHRANILEPSYRYLGIGWVERPDGSGYNTQNFTDQYSSSYGRNRQPAVGGLSDTRTPSVTMTVASFEGGWDPRLYTVRAGSGLTASTPVVDTPTVGGDEGARFTVKETSLVTASYAEMRVRDALNFKNATGLRLRMSATTGSGRAVTVQVTLRRELGTSVVLGTVSLTPGQVRTVTLPVPAGARNFRNVVAFAVTAKSLNALSGSLTARYATVRVRDIAVTV